MQLKNFYSTVSVLGIASVMALTACGDDSSDAQFVANPGISQQTPETTDPGNGQKPDSI